MPGLFSAIDTMSTALQAFQQQLDVTGNNISNVNTPGYNREVVSLTEAPETNSSTGAEFTTGNGVSVSAVNRIQNLFLQQQSQNAASATGNYSTMSDGLNSIQSALNEPGTNGVTDALSSFFNAWSGLASSPASSSSQLAVQTAAQTLTQRVQTLNSDLNTQSTQATASIQTTLSTIQTDINNIAHLNTQISLASASGSTANALEDQRDQAVQSLGTLVNISTQSNQNGTVNVSMGGMTLLDQAGPRTFPTIYNSANSTVSDGVGNTFPVSGGQLAGAFGVLNTISGYQSQLNTFANTVTSAVNTIYATATNSAGATNQQFFNQTVPAGGAAGFSLAAPIAASSTAIATGTSGNAGDGGIAGSLANLQTQTQGTLGGQTIQGYYTNFVGAVGNQAQYYQKQVTTQAAVTTQINNQIQSVSGVSTDDEMASMLQYQRSYQAAAQALSTFNTTIQSLLSMMGG